MTSLDIEQLAIKLREAAFPGAFHWSYASQDTRDRWVKAAEYADSRIRRMRDTVLRDATAKAHELGQHEAARMLREMRRKGEVEP